VEFLRVDLGAFGGLRDLDTGPEPMGRLVAVLGPNEAGKTTLFNFLTAMLYGIYPASRDRNPYTPWSGGDIEGGAVLRVEAGETWEVRRRLLSSPSGTLTRGTITEDIRNRTLPCAEHVPREVFRQVAGSFFFRRSTDFEVGAPFFMREAEGARVGTRNAPVEHTELAAVFQHKSRLAVIAGRKIWSGGFPNDSLLLFATDGAFLPFDGFGVHLLQHFGWLRHGKSRLNNSDNLANIILDFGSRL